jgi:hypothetical protein
VSTTSSPGEAQRDRGQHTNREETVVLVECDIIEARHGFPRIVGERSAMLSRVR